MIPSNFSRSFIHSHEVLSVVHLPSIHIEVRERKCHVARYLDVPFAVGVLIRVVSGRRIPDVGSRNPDAEPTVAFTVRVESVHGGFRELLEVSLQR